jgi:hypothetical protein
VGRKKKEITHQNEIADYAVGYKKPPRQSQFKPGQSGNAKGRPKHLSTPGDVVRKQFRKKITITMGGKEQQVAFLEAILLKHASLAASGNHKSTEILLSLFGKDGNDQGDPLREVVQALRSRHEAHEAADRSKTLRKESKDDLPIAPAASRKDKKS